MNKMERKGCYTGHNDDSCNCPYCEGEEDYNHNQISKGDKKWKAYLEL